MELRADVAPNQEWDEGMDLDVGELGDHPVEALVHHVRIDTVVELLVDLSGDQLKVGLDLGSVWMGADRRRTRHT